MHVEVVSFLLKNGLRENSFLEFRRNYWTFIDLFLAYVLLCVSTITFFSSKLLRFYGLHLPCPCKGIFGYRNRRLCFHKILFEWPLKKVCSIQVMAANRFPFDLVWVKKGHSLENTNDKMIVNEKTCVNNNGVVELEDENSCSGPRFLLLVDIESGCDAKGKRVKSLKRRSGIRRRKRGSYDCGKNDSVIPCDTLQSDVVAFSSCLPCDGGNSRIEDRSSQSINPSSGKEVSLNYDEDDRTFHDPDEKSCHSYELNASTVDSPGQGIYSPSLELHYMNMSTTVKDEVQIVGKEDNRIKMLEKAIEEEKSAYAALYLELEKEITAAATAADDAVAMILRLQEEKATMEMEMRQYERLIEEKAAYDEEEMNIMQEILIREKENLFLEKELESYRPSLSFETCDDPSQAESIASNVKKDCADADHGEEVEENSQHKDRACNDIHRSFYDTESNVLDVHVIDDNIEFTSCPGANSKCKSLSRF